MVVLGGGGVGKSSLTIRFTQNHFVPYWCAASWNRPIDSMDIVSYPSFRRRDPTIEDTYRMQLTVDGEFSLLQILDTAGQEEFYAMRDSWVRSGECFYLVFSYTSRQSFDELDMYMEHIMRVKDAYKGEVPIVLVGNKVDLEGEFAVSFAEAEQKAADLNCPLISTSAKADKNVAESFHELVRVHRKFAPESRRKTGPIKPKRSNFVNAMCSNFVSSFMRAIKFMR